MMPKTFTLSSDKKDVVRKASHIKMISAITSCGLLISQSVYAADQASSGGIPGWVWGLLIIAILVGITFLPKKWIEPKQNKTPHQAPSATQTAKVAETKPAAAPKVETHVAAPTVAPKVETAPLAAKTVEQPEESIKETPKSEKPVEVVDALVEAKQLLVQQRFPQAVGVLNKGLQKDPKRSDLMLELLSIYVKQNDIEAFDTLFEQVKTLDDPITLIQAEELHDQLDRPAIVAEDNDLIEFDAKKAIISAPEPESAPETVADYATDSLTFASEMPKVAEPEQPETLAFDTNFSLEKTTEITPSVTEFSLDDLDFEPSVAKTTTEPVETVVAEEAKASDDFDFSDFDDFVLNTPLTTPAQDKATETPAIVAKDLVEPETVDLLTPATEIVETKAPTVESSVSSDLVDLDFDFEDSFAINEDKIETNAKNSDWSTDLADETFATPAAEPAFNDPFATEVAPEPVVPIPVAPPKVEEPVAKDLATTLEEEFPFLQTADTFQTRLDLARNYIALGEISSAKELLNEVAAQAEGTQQTEARELIAKLAS